MGQIDPYYDNFDDLYVSRFNGWIKGTVLIPCFFMRTCAVVHPNGDVVLCQKKNLKLGNLYVNSFSEIWNSKKTMEIQRQHRYCTACWVSSHKTFDLEIIKNFEKVIPKRILEKIIGPYQI
jgi:MoaA/NifB/PqqE/SkfB family radical SAM enzyme